MISNAKKWELSNNEVAYFAPKSGYANAASLQLFIPKIQMNQSLGIPKVSSPSSLNASCLINDNSCKPAVSKTYRTQNYITVKRNVNDIFDLSFFHQGDQILVEVLHGDVNNMRVTNHIDNSHRTP